MQLLLVLQIAFFSGSCMLIFDVINPCTRNKMVPMLALWEQLKECQQF